MKQKIKLLIDLNKLSTDSVFSSKVGSILSKLDKKGFYNGVFLEFEDEEADEVRKILDQILPDSQIKNM